MKRFFQPWIFHLLDRVRDDYTRQTGKPKSCLINLKNQRGLERVGHGKNRHTETPRGLGFGP